jgi:hypothetical protein
LKEAILADERQLSGAEALLVSAPCYCLSHELQREPPGMDRERGAFPTIVDDRQVKLKDYLSDMVFWLIGANALIMKIHFKCISKKLKNSDKIFRVCI